MIALKTMFYNPADFPMDSPASMALTDRMNGIFAALEISPDKFTAAYELPIGEHVEKNYKGLSYLSWPFAFRHLKEQFPTFFVSFEESSIGWPVFGKEGCWLLRPFLTDGCRRTPALVFPLMDNKHNPRPSSRCNRKQRSLLRGQARRKQQLRKMIVLLEQQALLPPMQPVSSMAKKAFLDSVRPIPLAMQTNAPA